MDSTVAILLATFLMSIAGLFAFIWSLRKGLFDENAGDAATIFARGEIGHGEEPATTRQQQNASNVAARSQDDRIDVGELTARIAADRSSALPVFVFLTSAVVWLLVGSAAGIVSSIKLHAPDWLTDSAWLTFGRLRTVHLNAVIYGWSSMACIAVALWLIPRLLKTPLRGARFAVLGAMLFNTGLAAGIGAISLGISDGLEFLEIPWQVDILIFLGIALVLLPLLSTLANRTVRHLYVSVWYLGAAMLWFPVLFLVANIPDLHHGVEQATMNWWYGHNALGLWFTPIAIAAVYYFVPKVLGQPVRSYNLSLLGFWCLAFFYPQVGGHHLIGGPIPEWLITLSIVQSGMMVVPVVAFAVNQSSTLSGRWSEMRHSPTLRFVVFGALMYVAVSIQGSIEAIRSVNTITHFTHFTVAHAHLGMYGFVGMVLFGAIYFILPRVMFWEWPYPALISVHFWLVAIGISIYFIGLTIGGWLQGLAMMDAKRPFIDSVLVTLPYLQARSVGGALMTLGHLVFAFHVAAMVLRYGPARIGPAVLGFTTERPVWKTS
jgi:cytochrome c oxidase cbb3-type subunit I